MRSICWERTLINCPDSLEQTISELKTANNELQRDVEKKEAVDEMRKGVPGECLP